MFTSFHCSPTSLPIDAPSLDRKVEPSLSRTTRAAAVAELWPLPSGRCSSQWANACKCQCARVALRASTRLSSTASSSLHQKVLLSFSTSPVEHMPSCSIHQLPSEAHPATLLHVPTRARWLFIIEPFSRSSTAHPTDPNFIVVYPIRSNHSEAHK